MVMTRVGAARVGGRGAGGTGILDSLMMCEVRVYVSTLASEPSSREHTRSALLEKLVKLLTWSLKCIVHSPSP